MSDLFQDKVVPIMDKVKADMSAKRAEELRKAMQSPGYAASVAFGGSSAFLKSKAAGSEWSSKTVEDYVKLVNEELRKQNITVTPDIEKKMLARMVNDAMPKSSIEYIIKKAKGNTIFGTVDSIGKSELQEEIDHKAEKAYNPSAGEKAAAYAASAVTDWVALGGPAGTVGSIVGFTALDMGVSAVADGIAGHVEDKKLREKDKMREEERMKEEKYKDVPSVVDPAHRDEWLTEQEQKAPSTAQSSTSTSEEKKSSAITTPWQEDATAADKKEDKDKEEKSKEQAASEQARQEEEQRKKEEKEREKEEEQDKDNEVMEGAVTAANMTGWQGLWDSLGVGGLSNIAHNPGTTAAMLPDVLMGIFTGKTSMKGTLIPAAGLLSGMFMDKRNPLRKLVILASLLALINKPIQSGLAANNIRTAAPQFDKPEADRIANEPQYVRYQDEPLNERVSNPHIEGNRFEAYIDGVHRSLTLPDRAADAYNRGAVPLNKLANTMLSVIDQNDLLASENYEHVDNADREAIHKTISQR